MSGQEDVEDFVSNLVLAHWEKHQTAYLLSEIGSKIRRQYPDFRAPDGSGIKEFCRGIPTVQIVTHPDIAAKIGLVPATAPIPTDSAKLFEMSDNHARTIIYEDSFWNSFISPIKTRRFVCLSENGGFEVIEDEQPPVDKSCFEIVALDISNLNSQATIFEKAKETAMKVNSWLAKNKLDSSYFAKPWEETKARRGDNALIRIIEAIKVLKVEDQQRISVPFDIIIKLHQAR